jgi:MFS family permease
VVLAVGSLATAALAAVQGGLPAIAPAIQETFGLSLVEVTAVFTAFALGTVLTLLAWGVLSDRAGERIVIGGGLAAGGLAMLAAASSHGYTALLVWMALAGMLGSSAVAASGRAVFGWFPRDERGLALGLRQTAVPVGAALASFTLPPLASAAGVHAALYALAGAMLVSALASAIWLRDGPRTESAAPPAPDAARDPRIWRLSAASSLMIIGQVGVTSTCTPSATGPPHTRRSRSAACRSERRSRGCPPAAGPTLWASGSSRFAAWPRWPACCCSRPWWRGRSR